MTMRPATYIDFATRGELDLRDVGIYRDTGDATTDVLGLPKIKVGRLRLYELAKLAEWLSSHETTSVHSRLGGAHR